jgi:Arc/MetJ-type ribon-helix-helix transcriptional regulator
VVVCWCERFMYSKCIRLIVDDDYMEEVITSRFSEELVKKVDQAVSRGYFKSRSEALRMMIEEYLKEHPELFLGDKVQELMAKAPVFGDEELEKVGSRLFKGVSVAKLVAEGRG